MIFAAIRYVGWGARGAAFGRAEAKNCHCQGNSAKPKNSAPGRSHLGFGHAE